MKKLLLATAALCLMAAPAAFGQEDKHHDHDKGATAGAAAGGDDHGHHTSGQMSGPAAAAPVVPGKPHDDHNHAGNGWGNNAMSGHANFDRDHNGRHGNSNVNINVRINERNFTAPRHFHYGVYHRPQGWYAHRWTYGERLPSAFFVRDYWVTDYVSFGLDEPPQGYVWVRYGNDALLIDQYTGQIAEVEYGVFY